MTAEETVAAIRELHRPTDEMWPQCQGCDIDGWEADTPEWPCRTAKIVYTAAEIEVVERRAAGRREADRAQRATQPVSPTAALIPDLWGPKIHEILAQESFLARLNKRVNP